MGDIGTLKERIAGVHDAVQTIVNRNIAARAVLDASNSELAEAEQLAGGVSPEAARFLAAYRNPTLPNPEPLVPSIPMPETIVVPPVTEEPTVFTDVGTSDITPDNTSGGFTEEVAGLVADTPAFNPDAAEEAAAAGGSFTEATTQPTDPAA